MFRRAASFAVSWRGLRLTTAALAGGASFVYFPLANRRENGFMVQASSSGPKHTQGRIYTFGSNEFGQLGTGGGSISQATPTRVEGRLKNLDIVEIATGLDHVLALESSGGLYSWGRSQYQTLGYESETVVDNPVKILALSKVPVRSLAASETNSYAIDAEGNLWSWGRQRGLGRSLAQFSSGGEEQMMNLSLAGSGSGSGQGTVVPGVIPTLQDVIQIAAGRNFAIALTRDGRLHSWGDNRHGALGLGGRDSRDAPTPVSELQSQLNNDPLKRIAAGSQFSLCLTESGRLWFFGGNDYGQSGGMARRYERHPAEIFGLTSPGSDDQVVSVAAGRYHCAAVTAKGHVWTWGLGVDGQMGTGTRQTHNSTPSLVEHDFGGSRVVKVFCGGAHTAALTEDGRLYCWGRGRESQLGKADGLTSVAAYADTPQEVTWFTQHGLKVKDVALGNSFTAVLVDEEV